jgi:hypothetical protein
MDTKALVLMVEGESDRQSVPGLVTRLLESLGARDVLHVSSTMCVGDVHRLANRGSEAEWIRFVLSAAKKPALGAVLLLLDGDAKAKHPIRTSAGDMQFCAREVAAFLARRAREEAGAGTGFSLAIVFARQEFESWLLAGCAELAEGIGPAKDLEAAPRDAKSQIGRLRGRAYKETIHQPELTRRLDPRLAGARMRSFRRLEDAIGELAAAVREGRHVCTPA